MSLTLTSPYIKQDQKEFFYSKDSVTTRSEFDELFEALFNRDWIVNGETYNLPKLGWKRNYNRRIKALGICSYQTKRVNHLSFSNTKAINQYELLRVGSVFISATLLNENLDKAHDFEDTIRHEIAHAIHAHISGRSNHGRTWKSVARQLGANDSRCHEGFLVEPQGKYTLSCPNDDCSVTTEKSRRPKRLGACGKCCKKYNGGRFTPEYRLILVQNY